MPHTIMRGTSNTGQINMSKWSHHSPVLHKQGLVTRIRLLLASIRGGTKHSV